jgi:hypothetical protein
MVMLWLASGILSAALWVSSKSRYEREMRLDKWWHPVIAFLCGPLFLVVAVLAWITFLLLDSSLRRRQ